MLQSIRDKITGWFAIIFLGAIAVVFIFWGVETGSNAGARYAATVNGEGIPLEMVRKDWQSRERQLQQMMGGAIPEQMIKAQQSAILDEHIRRQLLTDHARELGYRVSDSLMLQRITSFPQLQVDGKFSPSLYQNIVQQQDRTVPEFEREFRATMQIDQLERGIAESAFALPNEVVRREALEGETREVDYAVIPASAYLASALVTEEQIQSWYDAHKAEYMTPETADIEYLELKLSDAESEVAVTDELLRGYYEQVKERLTTPERRRPRHILIAVGDGVNDATAEKTAQEVLAKLNAGGDFAALAKQYSKDPISTPNGGVLDWVSRGGSMGPFEEALFAMSKNEVRGPVKTEFGYHVLRLDEIEGGETKSYDDAKIELEKEYRAENAQKIFYERSQKLGDESFKALTELTTVAATLNLPLKKLEGFSRRGGGEFANDPKIIEAVFQEDTLAKNENSALIALGEDRAVVVRVATHHPPVQLPVAAVRTAIEFKLKDQAARDAAAKRGAELVARLDGGATWSAVLGDAKLASLGKRAIGRTEASIPAAVRQAIFSVSRDAVTAAKPAYRGAVTEDGGFAIVAVSEVRTGALVAGTPESAAKVRQVAQAQGNQELGAYENELQQKAKVDRNPKAFE